jgi:hypothetical protein
MYVLCRKLKNELALKKTAPDTGLGLFTGIAKAARESDWPAFLVDARATKMVGPTHAVEALATSSAVVI